jgi:hypothetical protein
MHRRVLVAISIALAFGGFVTTAPRATAGSRFEAGEAAPVHATVRLDFTIVIPELLTLAIARYPQALDAAFSRWSLAVPAMQPAPEMAATGQDALPTFVATGNAGTLAVGATDPGAVVSQQVTQEAGLASIETRPSQPGIVGPSTSVSLDTHSAIFLIALP